MKKSILSLILTAMALCAVADPVSSSMARTVANAWAARNTAFGAGAVATRDVRTVYDPTNAEIVLWHQVTMRSGGMLVVAPATEIEPVIMALEKDPGDLPAAHPLRGILTGDMRRRLQFLGLYSAEATNAARTGASLASASPAASSATSTSTNSTALAWGQANDAKWKRLLATASTATLQSDTITVGVDDIAVNVCTVRGFEQGGALTHWNQGADDNGEPLYNYYTPGNAVCGCVATAAAALAQFYGAAEAVSDYENTACAYNNQPYTAKTIGGPIDWSILPANYGGTAEDSTTLTDEQRELIGRVAFNAGVGVSMLWTDGESMALESKIVTALKEVFGFSNARYVRIAGSANPSQTTLSKLIYNQCRAGVPVGMGIAGHSVLAAGYGLDSEGVERVRVFMGWSGSGDGWYALPKIDTTATVGGGTYLSEVVDGVVTMISCADDNIVPIVGHVDLPNATLEVPAYGLSCTANDAGYFGLRVPAVAVTLDVTCQDHVSKVAVGEAAATATTEKTLCAQGVLPDAFEFMLLNSTVAYSLETAKLLADQEGKAILRLSGDPNDETVKAVVKAICALDAANTGNFTNLFVYYFTSAGTTEGDGADISYGVYLPRDLDTDSQWVISNGALAYGYSSTVTYQTNLTHAVDETAEDADSARDVNFTYTFAPIDAEMQCVTNDVTDVEGVSEAVQAAVLESVARVIGFGAVRLQECLSGISVTVATTEPAADTALDAAVEAANATGLHENCYTNGVQIFTAPAEITNETVGVVWSCEGWSATNLTTGATAEGDGVEAALDLEAANAYALTWNYVTNAVYIAVQANCQNGGSEEDGAFACAPGSGWYAYGEAVTFEATCAGGFQFRSFKFSNGVQVEEDYVYTLSATKILVWPELPTTLNANFIKVKAGTAAAEEPTADITFTATSVFLKGDAVLNLGDGGAPTEAPTTTVYSASEALQIASGASATATVVTHDGSDATKVDYLAQITPLTFTDAEGHVWELLGVVPRALTADDTAETLVEDVLAGGMLSDSNVAETDVALTWVWYRLDDDDDEPVTTAFVIAWDDALTTLNARGYTTNLISLAALRKNNLTIDDVTVTAPKGFTPELTTATDETTGEEVVQASLKLDEATLQPKAVEGESAPLTIFANADGNLTVQAKVANGVTGFWYALQATDDLNGMWSVVKTGYVAGTPVTQATADDATVTVSIDVDPALAKMFYRLVVTDVDPTTL